MHLAILETKTEMPLSENDKYYSLKSKIEMLLLLYRFIYSLNLSRFIFRFQKKILIYPLG